MLAIDQPTTRRESCWTWMDHVYGSIIHVPGTRHVLAQCRRGDLESRLWLTDRVHSDLALFDVPLPEGADEMSLYTTLEHTLLRALMVAFQLDESELAGFLAPGVEPGVPHRVVLYETAVGGSGVLASPDEPGRLATTVQRARELLHEGDPTGGCERACYECLLSFSNQRDHAWMDRRAILPWLRGLEGVSLELQPEEDALADLEVARVGSGPAAWDENALIGGIAEAIC